MAVAMVIGVTAIPSITATSRTTLALSGGHVDFRFVLQEIWL